MKDVMGKSFKKGESFMPMYYYENIMIYKDEDDNKYVVRKRKGRIDVDKKLTNKQKEFNEQIKPYLIDIKRKLLVSGWTLKQIASYYKLDLMDFYNYTLRNKL